MTQRPDPDELLERVQAAEAQARRGKLKIFFGASAGVGKTYAMLSAARQQRELGVDVVAGVIETHGRAETAALLADFEQLPLKEIAYRERTLHEFDLDGALQRKPALILVDELAHSNVDGSLEGLKGRHPKRWQDIDELLAAGIDVFTTVNVQHIESLNDVVGGITGIRVWETVPDHVFDAADEVVLVDLSPDDLLQRLRDGKVYMPQQAERAIRNFFRKGNLIALRELALRRTADRVDDEMREYRREQSVAAVWGARESLLVCVGADVGDEKLVRAAARLAAKLDARWHAIYVETPALQRLPVAARERILKTLNLAQELGAETATLPGNDVAAAIVEYARNHNFAQVLVGRSQARAARFWRRALCDRIAALAPDIATLQIARDERAAETSVGRERHAQNIDWPGYAKGIGICVLTLLITLPLRPLFDLANIVMVFLLSVVLVALRFGRGPAALAAVLNVAAFDFFFVSPTFSFAVSDAQYLLTFAIMLGVALLTGQLTANLKYQARVSINREQRAGSLYEMARELSAALLPEQVRDIAARFVGGNFRARAAVLLADADDRLAAPDNGAFSIDNGIAQWVFDHAQPAGLGTDTLPSASALYLPLIAPMRARGVLVVLPEGEAIDSKGIPRWLLIPEQRRLLDTFAALIAIAIERVHYVDIAQQTTVQIESERLRNSLLSTLSHDLRTPLTTLMGFAEFLTMTKPPLAPEQQEVALAIYGEAQRMTALVNNLLDMSRLQAGEVKLNREWQPLEEVVGAALVALRVPLAQHRLHTALPADLPLVEFDAVLMERVFSNLLENAAKYTPPGSEIRIEARVDGDEFEIVVADDGPGLPAGMEDEIFKKFTRGQSEGNTAGVGLGLAICRAIIAAHNGRIYAEHAQPHGARFIIRLPLGAPPLQAPPLHDPPPRDSPVIQEKVVQQK